MHSALILFPLAFASAALPAVHAANGSQEAAETDIIDGRTDGHDRLTVPVQIGAHGPYRFLVDTGAQNTVLSRSIATEMALPLGRQHRLVGVAGTQMVDTVQIEQIDLGRRSYFDLLAPLLDRDNIGADGILGIDSLQQQRVLIDFRRNIIAVDDAQTLGGNRGYEIVVTARRRSGQLIMTDATLDGIRMNVVIDTGAETSIGNRALQRAMARRRSVEQTVLHSVTGQQITADLSMGRKLDIGQISFVNVQIAYADSPAFAALGLNNRPTLLLGIRDLRALDRVAIDFSTRRIYFDVPPGVL
jgi:predicted aspartyl protease